MNTLAPRRNPLPSNTAPSSYTPDHMTSKGRQYSMCYSTLNGRWTPSVAMMAAPVVMTSLLAVKTPWSVDTLMMGPGVIPLTLCPPNSSPPLSLNSLWEVTGTQIYQQVFRSNDLQTLKNSSGNFQACSKTS